MVLSPHNTFSPEVLFQFTNTWEYTQKIYLRTSQSKQIDTNIQLTFTENQYITSGFDTVSYANFLSLVEVSSNIYGHRSLWVLLISISKTKVRSMSMQLGYESYPVIGVSETLFPRTHSFLLSKRWFSVRLNRRKKYTKLFRSLIFFLRLFFP